MKRIWGKQGQAKPLSETRWVKEYVPKKKGKK